MMIMKGEQIVDYALKQDQSPSTGYLIPVIGVENGAQLDFDMKNEKVFWIQLDDDKSENVSEFS